MKEIKRIGRTLIILSLLIQIICAYLKFEPLKDIIYIVYDSILCAFVFFITKNW